MKGKFAWIISWCAVVLWAAFIFFMSAHTGSDLNEGFFDQVKQLLNTMLCAVLGPVDDPVSPFCHFCEYTLFGALLANALRFHMPLPRACLLAIACASAYGVTDELHQLFVPNRACDPIDWLVDTAGASLGAFLAWVLLRGKAESTSS